MSLWRDPGHPQSVSVSARRKYRRPQEAPKAARRTPRDTSERSQGCRFAWYLQGFLKVAENEAKLQEKPIEDKKNEDHVDMRDHAVHSIFIKVLMRVRNHKNARF